MSNRGAASEVRELLEDPEASVSGKDPPHFWVMVAALKRFVEDQGKGSLPLEVQIAPLSSFQKQPSRSGLL